MKLFAFLAIIGLSSAAHMGIGGSARWTPGHEYVFEYNGRLLTGIPELDKTHFSGMGIQCEINLRVQSDNRISLQINDARYSKLSQKQTPSGGDQNSENWRFLQLPQAQPFPDDIKNDLHQPAIFEVSPTNGDIRAVTVSGDESTWSINFKKALVNLFQTKSMQHGGEFDPSGRSSSAIPYSWTVYEDGIDGECETHYEMKEVPLSESEKLLTRPQFCPRQVIDSLRSNAYYVTKTRNLENCRTRASYSSYKPGSFSCKDGNCGGQWSRSSITRYVICGNPDDYVIQSIVNEGELHQDLLGYQTEKWLTGTRQVIKLKEVRSLPSGGLGQPKNPTLMPHARYELPSASDVSQANGRSSDVDKNRLKREVTELLKDVTQNDFKSSRSLPQKDISMKILLASKVLRIFNVQELHSIYKDVISSNRETSRELIKNVVVDTMIMSGSSDSFRFFKTMVDSSDGLSITQIASIFASLPRTVATPTEELLEEVYQLIKSSQKLRQHERTYHIALLSMSNLIQKACLSSNRHTSFPTWLYGKFCNSESSIITEEWIPYLTRELRQTESAARKNALLVALGLLSHEQIIPAVLPTLEEESSHVNPEDPVSHMTRFISVYSIVNVGKYHPERVLPILTALYSNKAERTEIRIAAFNAILTMKPDMALLQKIATLTWSEEDLEVLKTVNTAFYSLSRQVSMQQYQPSSSLMIRQARLLYPLIKKEGGSFPSSATIYTNTFFRKMAAGYERMTSWIGSRGSLMPSSMYNKFVYFFSEYKFSPLEVGVHLCGIETVTQEILDVITGQDKSDEEIESHLNPEWKEAIDKLRIETREGGNLEGSIYVNFMETSSVFGSFKSEGARAVREEVRRLMKNPSAIKEHLDGNGNINFQRMLNLAPSEFIIPSDMGLPIGVEYHMPTILSVSGSYQKQFLKGGVGSESTINAQMHAFFDGRVSGWVGTYSPVDKEYIVTGIDQHLAVDMPLDLEIVIDINQGNYKFNLKSSRTSRTSADTFDMVYYRVLPFTVTQNIYNLKPVFNNPKFQKISSGSQIESKEVDFGQDYLGLDFKLTSRAETSHLGWRMIWEKLYMLNWNPLNLIRFFWTSGAVKATGQPSVRFLETALNFNPETSTTQQLQLVGKFGYGTRVAGDSIRYHTVQVEKNSARPFKLVSKPLGQLSAQSGRQQKIKEAFEKMNVDSDGRAATASLAVTLSGRAKKPLVYSYSLTAGSGSQGLKQKWNLHAQSGTDNKKNLCVEGEIDIPYLPEWSISQMRSKSPQFKFENVISAGHECSERKFVIQGSTKTSEHQKKWSRTSPEGKEYDRLLSKGTSGIEHSELAAEVRRQASTVDIIDYELKYINVPKSIMYFPRRAMEFVKVYWFPYYNSSMPEVDAVHSNGEGANLKTIVQTRIHPDTQAFDVFIKNSGDSDNKYYYTDIPLEFPLNYLYPLSYEQSPAAKWVKSATGGSLYPTCALVGKTVVTFDNKTVRATIDKCMHMLSGDCGHQKEYSVFVRSTDPSHYGDSKKEVKIFLRDALVEFRGESDGLVIKINGHRTPIQEQEKKPVANSQGEIVGVVTKSSDDVVILNSDKVSVFFDGKDVIVKGSMMLKNKLCGLCGDNNNQKIADLTSPGKCLLSKPEIMVASYRVPLGDKPCKPLPRELSEMLAKEIGPNCVRASSKSTKVSSSYKSGSQCTHHGHELIEKSDEFCFSKIPLARCGFVCRPSGMVEKRVGFTCMRKDSRSAMRIADKVRSGEIISSLKNFPTTFTAERRLPATCVPVL